MKGQVMTEFIITFSFFFFIIIILLFVSQSKIEDYYNSQNRQDIVLKCKMVGDLIASNLSYKQNELNVSAIHRYLNKSNVFSIVWNDKNGYHKIGNLTSNFSINRIYIINGEVHQVKVMCK